VVTVAAGEAGKKMLTATGDHMRRYAESIGADFVVLDWPGIKDWPVSAKFAVARVLDHYDRILYLDADVLCRAGAVNVFDLCGPDEFGFVDELEEQRKYHKGSVEEIYKRFRTRMGHPEAEIRWMLNSGVMVVPKSHQAVLEVPDGLWVEDVYPGRHFSEQNAIGAALLASGLSYRILPKKANYQDWTDPGFRKAPKDALLHASGAGKDRFDRARMLTALAVAHPWPFTPGVEPPADGWSADLRHVRWIRDTLQTGRFRKVLEVGCMYGYSTSAFLDALKAGRVDSVDLCEPAPTPELRALLAGAGDKVRLHECTVQELFARPWGGWDLVFLDGDHDRTTAEVEVKTLLRNRVRAVFVHDSASAFTGPPVIKEGLAGAGYKTVEDAVARPGEITDRGMLFATLGAADFRAGAAAGGFEVPAAKPAARVPLEVRPPCRWEGDVVVPCGSYHGDEAEKRHVRECDLLGGFCTRAAPEKGHKVCAACTKHEVEA
jgi:hypothetical protein